MLMNWYHYLFITLMMNGTMIATSSSSWITSWLGLELNLMSIIPLIMFKMTPSNSEASIKYFMVQAFSSLIFIVSIITYNYSSNVFMPASYNLLLFLALCIKMGAAPFHFWFPQVIQLSNWLVALTIMTWQKIAPLVLISLCVNNFFAPVIIISAMTGALGAMNQLNLKKIMAYSSIAHLGWMLAIIMININSWLLYFLIYSLMVFNIVILFNHYGIVYINKLINLNMQPQTKMILIMNIFSLGGLPPFVGFIAKIMVINKLLEMNMFFILIFLVISSLISLYFYTRVNYSLMFLNSSSNKMVMQSNKKNFLLFSVISVLMNLTASPIFLLL